MADYPRAHAMVQIKLHADQVRDIEAAIEDLRHYLPDLIAVEPYHVEVAVFEGTPSNGGVRKVHGARLNLTKPFKISAKRKEKKADAD